MSQDNFDDNFQRSDIPSDSIDNQKLNEQTQLSNLPDGNRQLLVSQKELDEIKNLLLRVSQKELDEIKSLFLQESTSIERVERRLTYSGPIPHPDILRGYEEVLSGSADRILKMTEKQLDHRIAIENKLVHGENQSRLLGQIAGFIIAIFGLGGSVFLGYNGKTWESGIMSGGTLAGLVAVFVKGSSDSNQENEKLEPTKKDVES